MTWATFNTYGAWSVTKSECGSDLIGWSGDMSKSPRCVDLSQEALEMLAIEPVTYPRIEAPSFRWSLTDA